MHSLLFLCFSFVCLSFSSFNLINLDYFQLLPDFHFCFQFFSEKFSARFLSFKQNVLVKKKIIVKKLIERMYADKKQYEINTVC